MPRITIGNELDLHALTDDELQQLERMFKKEVIRRREAANPDTRHQTAKVDGRVRYVTWDDVKEILLPHYENESKASYYASRVWNELYRATCYGEISLEGYCGFCRAEIRRRRGNEPWTSHRIGCPSRADNRAKTVLFSRRSLVTYRDKFLALDNTWLEQRVRIDAERVLDVLATKRTRT